MSGLYVPPTDESDHKKQNQSLQLIGGITSTNTTNIATNTSNISTNTANIATNTANIATNTANIATNTTNIATNTASIAAMQAAWTTYTPTITASAGTFTTVSAAGAYLVNGKTVIFSVSIGITTAGTASGVINLPLPIGTTKRVAVLTAVLTNTGEAAIGQLAASATSATVAKYNGTTVIGSGNVINVSGVYEQT